MSSEKQAEKLQTEMVKTGAALVPGADLHVVLSPDVEQELLGQLHELGIDAPQLDGVLTVVAQTISREVVHSGPLPPPQQLAAYNEVGEDFAERIVQMAEREQNHRHNIERRVVTASVTTHWAGLLCGLLVSMGLMTGAYYSGVHGQPWVAAAFLAASAVGMVSAFVKGSQMGLGGGGRDESPPSSAPKGERPSLPAKGSLQGKPAGKTKARR